MRFYITLQSLRYKIKKNTVQKADWYTSCNYVNRHVNNNNNDEHTRKSEIYFFDGEFNTAILQILWL